MVRWKNDRIFMNKTFAGDWVGLEEIDDGIWSLYYGRLLLARFDEREMKFYG
jgi:putative transposase